MKMELGTCQVRSETYSPCTRPAALKILGVPFCEQCAYEQRAYFAIGELAQARGPRDGWTRQARSIHNKALVEMLDRRQRKAKRFAEARERRENSLEGAVTRSCTVSRKVMVLAGGSQLYRPKKPEMRVIIQRTPRSRSEASRRRSSSSSTSSGTLA